MRLVARPDGEAEIGGGEWLLLAAWLAPDEAAFTEFISGSLSRLASGLNGFVQAAVTRVTTTLFAVFLLLLMLFFLFRVTGIPATEEQALRSKGDAYREYQRTTSAFVPWFPRA